MHHDRTHVKITKFFLYIQKRGIFFNAVVVQLAASLLFLILKILINVNCNNNLKSLKIPLIKFLFFIKKISVLFFPKIQ